MARVLPRQLVDEIESFIDREVSDVAKYDNRAPYDDSTSYTLYALAAKFYDEGFSDGWVVAERRLNAQRRRELDSGDGQR